MGQVNPVKHFATVDLTEVFIGELSMHRVPRAFFDLIPGTAEEITGINGIGTYWTKNLRMSSGRSHVPLTVFCDEPPSLPISEGEESCPVRSAADQGGSEVERAG